MGIMSGRRSRAQRDELSKKQEERVAKKGKGKKKAASAPKAAPAPEVKEEAPKKAE